MDIDRSQFSEREKEVIGLLLQGRSNKQIALELHIAQSTVEYHLKNIYQKLGVGSRTEAVIRLGKSISKDMPSGSQVSTELDNKPISQRKLFVNRKTVRIAILLMIAWLLSIDIPTRPDEKLEKLARAFIAKGEGSKLDLLDHLQNPRDNPKMLTLRLPKTFPEVFEFIHAVKNGEEKLYLYTVLLMMTNRVLDTPTASESLGSGTQPLPDRDYPTYLKNVTKLWTIREAHPLLAEGSLAALGLDDLSSNIIAFARFDESQTIIVILNSSETPQDFKIHWAFDTCDVKNLWNEMDQNLPLANNGALSGTMDAWEAKILLLQCQ